MQIIEPEMCERAKVSLKVVHWQKGKKKKKESSSSARLLCQTLGFKPNSLQMSPNVCFVVCEFEAQRLFEAELEEPNTSEPFC